MAKNVHIKFETPRDLSEKIYQVVTLARDTGKLRKGTNEVTKIVERNEAKLVVIAEDVDPPEIVAHLPMLCDEKKVPYGYVPSKVQLGNRSGVAKGTASVAIIESGKGKPLLDEIIKELEGLKK